MQADENLGAHQGLGDTAALGLGDGPFAGGAGRVEGLAEVMEAEAGI